MKVLVYSQDHNGKVRGQIDQLLEDTALAKLKNPLYLDGTLVALDIPEGIDKQYLIINDEDDVLSVGENIAVAAENTLAGELAVLKAEMNSELYALMYSVAGTSDFNAATLYEKTWNKMVSNPSNYSNLGLTARFDRGGLEVGEALDTNQKVQDYAQACLDVSDAAEITRMQRIEQYKLDAAALVASYTPSL